MEEGCCLDEEVVFFIFDIDGNDLLGLISV